MKIHLPQKLATLLGTPFKYILKKIKSLYNIFEISNDWFDIYDGHYLNKLGRRKLIYDLCFVYKPRPLGIIKIEMDETLIFAKNKFTIAEKDTIKIAKIFT